MTEVPHTRRVLANHAERRAAAWLRDVTGWLWYVLVLAVIALALPSSVFDASSPQFILLLGAIGIWRYGMGAIHFVRGMLFLRWVFPRARSQARALPNGGLPSHLYFVLTSFRIETTTTASVYRSAIEEAMRCPFPTTIVASIVEKGDEYLIRALFEELDPPPRVVLRIVRIGPSGKRDGLAYAFRAVANAMPPADALVAVIDGDTVIDPGIVKRCAPFFALYRNVGGLTTNEHCDVRGSYAMREWHRLRFAQRHLNMCSMALSKRVLTMTGRMSMFRAAVVTDRKFVLDVENDFLEHWRLGRFRFLTGDDKSSWFSLTSNGWKTYYVPDASINTIEHPPSDSFFNSSLRLMFRWYGNSLRQNSRALRLGPNQVGAFPFLVLLDQRISMWTTLIGPCFALVGTIKYSYGFMLVYIMWLALTRGALTVLLLLTGHRVGPMFPLLLYYNQVVGSLVKVYTFNRLDRQSWTRQSTRLQRGQDPLLATADRWSSGAVTFAAVSLFFAVVLYVV